MLCERFNAARHGLDAQSDPSVKGHYMAMVSLNRLPKTKLRLLCPEIVEVVELKDGVRVAILKTFWIRILCRKWRQRRSRRLWFMATQRQYTHRRG
jgi:hypothetical protein